MRPSDEFTKGKKSLIERAAESLWEADGRSHDIDADAPSQAVREEPAKTIERAVERAGWGSDAGDFVQGEACGDDAADPALSTDGGMDPANRLEETARVISIEERVEPQSPPAAEPAEPAERAEPGGLYSQTRTTHPDPAELRERRLVTLDPSDPLANLFAVLRSRVLRAMRANNLSCLAIVGPTSGIGKSLVAANLSLSIAQEPNQTVIAVDLDLRRPKLAWYFGIEPEHGLVDHVTAGLPIAEILVNPGIDGLVLLPGRPVGGDPSDTIASPRMQTMLAEIKQRYSSRMVILDLAPLLGVADALSVLPAVDAVLFVIEEGVTTRAEIEECKQLLNGVPVVGSVVNRSRQLAQREYGYYLES